MSTGAPTPAEPSSSSQFRFDVGFRLALVLSPDGTVRSVAEISQLGETKPDAFLGRSIVEIAAQRGSGESGAALWTTRLNEARSSSGALHFADRPPGTPPNTPPSIDSSLTPIRREDGSLEAILFTVEDRTAFFHTQRRLHESQERFRNLAESLPQLVWTASPQGQVEYFAPRWSTFTGRTGEELLGTGYRDLVHPDDIAALASASAAGDWDAPVHFRLRRADGEYRTMEAFIAPVYDEDGTLTRLVGATADITQRRANEERSRELQEQLSSALAMTGLGRFTVDLRSPQLTGDERLSDIMGMKPSDLLRDADPDRLFDQIHPDDQPRIREAFGTALTGGRGFEEEYRILRPTSAGPEERWVSAAGRAEFDDDGPTRMFGVVQDITDRRREDEVRLRTQKREAIGTLASGIAHDFNNVIGAILSNAALAETELDVGDSPRTSIAEIRRGARRAADLVRRMLAVSREDEPLRSAVDLADVAREACALLRPTLPPDIELSLEIEPGPTFVLGDATQLHQVVMNLVTNAGQAIGEAGGTITLRIDRVVVVRAEDDDGPTGACLRLQVRDDGPGMPEEIRRRAFDPFFTTKGQGEGTGLGLAATQTIIRSHGGAVQIDSLVDHHTTLTVWLPAAASAESLTGPLEPAATPMPATNVTGPPSILFVDDEHALAKLAERAIPAYGCTATVFTDPRAALEAFLAAPEQFDALVTDLSMPGMTGLELGAEVRALRPNLPVIVTSGFLTPENEQEADRLGVSEIIAKPCSIDELTSAVFRLVEEAASRASGADPAATS